MQASWLSLSSVCFVFALTLEPQPPTLLISRPPPAWRKQIKRFLRAQQVPVRLDAIWNGVHLRPKSVTDFGLKAFLRLRSDDFQVKDKMVSLKEAPVSLQPASAPACKPAEQRMSLDSFASAAELEALGPDVLKRELSLLGLECGGAAARLSDRAARLWATRGVGDLTTLPPAMFASSNAKAASNPPFRKTN